jgi:hypothetical protein
MKTLIGMLGVGAVVVASATVGFATTPNTLPAGTKVTGKLASGSSLIFVGSIDGVNITVTCTSFSASGKTPASPSDTVDLTKPPKITGCTDSLFGNDTIKTNSTNGKWELVAAGSGPYTVSLVAPKLGATFTSTADPGCTVETAPKKPSSITGSYDTSTGEVTDSAPGSEVTTTGKGCTTSKDATVAATIVLTPNPGAPPF